MKLIPIPEDQYEEYRLTLLFDCYKWDPQFLDQNTTSRYVLVLSWEEHEEIRRLTEALDRETRAAELILNSHPELAGPLKLPLSFRRELRSMSGYEPERHVRLMRYDFHPVKEGGWAVSEVNSDVPGGFAEASLMPEAAEAFLGNSAYWHLDFGEILTEALEKKLAPGSRIMLVHCTCYSDDRQVMQFLGNRLEKKGFGVIYAAADHLRFREREAFSILDGNEGRVDAIVRFTPLEWLVKMRPRHWRGYFGTAAVSCNHPIALYAQTKRFPFVWDCLEENGIQMSAWRSLLPETLEAKEAWGKEGYIFKPVYGRVGEKVGIPEACGREEYQKILSEVRRRPGKYIAQKRFHSLPLEGEDGERFHLCLGSYTVDGRHAGCYGRISRTPRIDSAAADIPVLIKGREKKT